MRVLHCNQGLDLFMLRESESVNGLLLYDCGRCIIYLVHGFLKQLIDRGSTLKEELVKSVAAHAHPKKHMYIVTLLHGHCIVVSIHFLEDINTTYHVVDKLVVAPGSAPYQ